VAEETNPRAIERWGKAPILCIVPDVPGPVAPPLSLDLTAAIATVEWDRLARRGGERRQATAALGEAGRGR
jgi:hypothetical protein